jgi:hypothetical protein
MTNSARSPFPGTLPVISLSAINTRRHPRCCGCELDREGMWFKLLYLAKPRSQKLRAC